ncbi:hotdog fold thioesterase [Aurantivibrio infirmus]
MSKHIWFQDSSIEFASRMIPNTMAGFMGIEITEVGDDFIVGSMPVSQKVVQPMGLVHGGANVALAETVGSIGANLILDRSKKVAVGQEINANHVRGINKGVVHCVARPAYIGRTSQVWDIRIHDDRDRLSCISRLTMAVIDRP